MLQPISVNIFLEYIIPIIQFFILLIPFLGSGALYDKRKKYYRRFSIRGYILVLLAIFLIICSVKKHEISEELNKIKDKEISVRDSINQYRTQELLAKYGLKVDTKNDEIVKILRDSSLRKTTTIYKGNMPYFQINNIEMSVHGDTLFGKVWYCSKEAVSYSVNVYLDIIAYSIKKDSFSIVVKNLRNISIVNIPKDECLISDGSWVIRDMVEDDIYIFQLHGTYQTSEHKIIDVGYYSQYNFNNKQFGLLSPDLHYKITEFLEKNKKRR